MKNTKHLWRGLFFILLIAALCGGLALPAVTLPARAAPQQQVATNVVISEFRTRGPNGGNDDFVEIYNPTANPIDVSGWLIRTSNSSGTPNTRYAFPSITILQAGQHFIIVGSNYSGSVQEIPIAALSAGIPDDGGIAVALSDGTTIIDQVGMSAGSSYGEGTRLTSLTTDVNRSYERRPGGASDSCQDTNDNIADFQLLNPSNPQTSLYPLSLCGTVLPTITPTSTLTDTPTPTETGTPTNTGTATSTGTVTNTGTATATPTNTSSGIAASVVISEFRTRGPRGANDEFIELYNPTTAPIDISGWKINASNETGGTGTRATIPPSTLLRSGQYYLVANNAASDGYLSATVPPNLTYGVGISDNGGIALLRANDTVVDQVGMSAGSTYKEGTPLSPLPANFESYERKSGGAGNNCQDTNNNADDFLTRSESDPQNYASQLNRCGTLLTIPVLTTTTITADTPDPSLVNTNVTVSVRVTGGSVTPSGTVNITGANTNCPIILNASGTGSCTVRFTSTGAKTLTAIYIGDQTHLASSDTESHQVSTTITVPTSTRVPTPIPPPPLLVINEFVPRPGHDWNMDGVINVGDEYIEILNHGVIDVNLSGYSLDDEVNIGSTPFHLPSDITLKPGERRVFYGSQTGLLLSDGGDGVRLLQPNGQLMDAYNYFVVRFPDQSYCRLPDNGGADDWNQNCFPTPGLQNSLSGSTVNPPTSGDSENLCPIADTLPDDFLFAECLPFGNNIWNPAYWDRFGWYNETYLPESPGKWPVFVD